MIRLGFISLALSIALGGARFSFAGGGDPHETVPTRDTVLKKYSYEEMQAVSNYFTAREDGAKAKILVCDPTMKQVRIWNQGVVRSLMDDKRRDEVAAFRAHPKTYIAKVKNCEARCLCEAYAMLLPDLEGEFSKSEEYKELDALVSAGAKRETNAQILSCAKAAKWFCESDLEKYLEGVR